MIITGHICIMANSHYKDAKIQSLNLFKRAKNVAKRSSLDCSWLFTYTCCPLAFFRSKTLKKWNVKPYLQCTLIFNNILIVQLVLVQNDYWLFMMAVHVDNTCLKKLYQSGDRVVYKSRQPAKFTGFSARFHQLFSLLH